jgi:hypothetical protein
MDGAEYVIESFDGTLHEEHWVSLHHDVQQLSRLLIRLVEVGNETLNESYHRTFIKYH